LQKKGVSGAGDFATLRSLITYPSFPALILHKTEPFWRSKEHYSTFFCDLAESFANFKKFHRRLLTKDEKAKAPNQTNSPTLTNLC
jgi:hypothetical protein